MTSFTKVWVVVSLIGSGAACGTDPLPCSSMVTGNPRLMSFWIAPSSMVRRRGREALYPNGGLPGNFNRFQPREPGARASAVGVKCCESRRVALACYSGPFRPNWLQDRAIRSIYGDLRRLLHSRAAFGIALPSPAILRQPSLGCGCSSGVEHDLAKVGVEGSNPFARSRFLNMAI